MGSPTRSLSCPTTTRRSHHPRQQRRARPTSNVPLFCIFEERARQNNTNWNLNYLSKKTIRIEFKKSPELDEASKEWCFALVKENMQKMWAHLLLFLLLLFVFDNKHALAMKIWTLQVGLERCGQARGDVRAERSVLARERVGRPPTPRRILSFSLRYGLWQRGRLLVSANTHTHINIANSYNACSTLLIATSCKFARTRGAWVSASASWTYSRSYAKSEVSLFTLAIDWVFQVWWFLFSRSKKRLEFEKVMLTCSKHNTLGQRFFRGKLKLV